jgi:hypothetical protein
VRDTKVLIHVNTISKVGDVINGKPYLLPANEPVEIDAFIADAIVSHIGHQYGIVEVNQLQTKTGISWDLDEALERAKSYLEQCDKATVDFYVRQQMEDRLGAGKPALPPTGLALEVIKARGINLRQAYGITPVGWTDPGAASPNASVGSGTATGSNEVSELKSQLAAQTSLLNKLIALIGVDHAELHAQEVAPAVPPTTQS